MKKPNPSISWDFIGRFPSQDTVDALRNTLTVLFPFGLLFYFGQPVAAVGIGTGTLLICLTDLPGSRWEKMIGALVSIFVFALVSTAVALAINHQLVLTMLLTVLGFMLVFVSAMGPRMTAIGAMGLVLATFTIGLRPSNALQYGLYVSLGGAWYYLVSLIQVWLFPYRQLQRALAKARRHTIALMKLRASGYDEHVSLSGFNAGNIRLYLKLNSDHEMIRRLLLGDRFAAKSKGMKAKKLLREASLLIDLYEQVSAVHYDYGSLRLKLSGSGALELIRDSILQQAELLAGRKVNGPIFDQQIDELTTVMERSPEMKELLVGMTLNLRATANLVSDLNSDSPSPEIGFKQFGKFLTQKPIEPRQLFVHLNPRSSIFRFALRMAILMLVTVGLIGLLPKESYGQWLPLTLIIVCRPSFALTLKRNVERLSGTLIGLCVGWGLIAINLGNSILLFIAVVSLFVFFAFLLVRYTVSAMAITVTVVLCLSIYHGNPTQILSERLLFTVAGCFIGIAASFVLPVKHAQVLKSAMLKAVAGNNAYLSAVTNPNATSTAAKLARKQAFLGLSAFNEALYQMENEPKWKRRPTANLRQIELLCFQLNGLIAAIPSKQSLSTGYDTIVSSLNEAVLHLEHIAPTLIFTTDVNKSTFATLDLASVSERLKICIANL